MNVQDVIQEARDLMTVKRVFGDPYEKDGITLVPAASIRGGAGGGVGTAQDEPERGWGGGGGLSARPVGVYVIKDRQVSWQPALDVNRFLLGGQIVAIVFLLTIRALIKSRTRR